MPLPAAGTGSIAIADGSELALLGEVMFTVDGLKHLKNPRIQVLAYQDGGLVYGEAGGIDHAFLLGGSSSDWQRAGGPADCHADLFYFLSGNHEWSGGGAQTGVVILASVDFAASG